MASERSSAPPANLESQGDALQVAVVRALMEDCKMEAAYKKCFEEDPNFETYLEQVVQAFVADLFVQLQTADQTSEGLQDAVFDAINTTDGKTSAPVITKALVQRAWAETSNRTDIIAKMNTMVTRSLARYMQECIESEPHAEPSVRARIAAVSASIQQALGQVKVPELAVEPPKFQRKLKKKKRQSTSAKSVASPPKKKKKKRAQPPVKDSEDVPDDWSQEDQNPGDTESTMEDDWDDESPEAPGGIVITEGDENIFGDSSGDANDTTALARRRRKKRSPKKKKKRNWVKPTLLAGAAAAAMVAGVAGLVSVVQSASKSKKAEVTRLVWPEVEKDPVEVPPEKVPLGDYSARQIRENALDPEAIALDFSPNKKTDAYRVVVYVDIAMQKLVLSGLVDGDTLLRVLSREEIEYINASATSAEFIDRLMPRVMHPSVLDETLRIIVEACRDAQDNDILDGDYYFDPNKRVLVLPCAITRSQYPKLPPYEQPLRELFEGQ